MLSSPSVAASTLTRLRRAAVLAVAALALVPAVASAHPLLVQAAPTPGLVAPRAPDGIALALSEPAIARGSEIKLLGPDGKALPVGKVTTSDGDRSVAVAPKSTLATGVYTVRYSVLGRDGHLVRGDFTFGVPGKNGALPPGVEKLRGPGAGGRGGEEAVADGAVTVIARWLGISAAAFLLGGVLLLTRLGDAAHVRRRREAAEEDDEPQSASDAFSTFVPLAWLLVVLAASEGVIAGAVSGGDGKFDLGLLTASPTGVASLVRAGVVVVASAALVALRARPRGRDRLLAVATVAALTSYGLSGHVLSDPTVWSLLDQGVHVVTASLWLGGVLALPVLVARGDVAFRTAARAFAPIAGAALGLAVLTGVLAAVREVDGWYFLRWSGYGRVVIIKASLVALVALAGAATWWRSRGAATREVADPVAGAAARRAPAGATVSSGAAAPAGATAGTGAAARRAPAGATVSSGAAAPAGATAGTGAAARRAPAGATVSSGAAAPAGATAGTGAAARRAPAGATVSSGAAAPAGATAGTGAAARRAPAGATVSSGAAAPAGATAGTGAAARRAPAGATVSSGAAAPAGATAGTGAAAAGARARVPGLVRLEAFGVLAVLALAATLSGLAQGRGQPLPAQRGTLIPGPSFAVALGDAGGLATTLAPARTGENVLSAVPRPGGTMPKTVSVRLTQAGAGKDLEATLRAGVGGTWSTKVDVPADGTWFGYLKVDGKESTAPVALRVGVPKAAGSTPVTVLATADLSGPNASRCRSHTIGFGLAVARVNAAGGLNDGHKLAPLVLDDGGSPARAAALTRQAIKDDHPIALAGACGDGAGAAAQAASDAGLPAVVGDPNAQPLTNAKTAYRLAADPYAQGLALGQLVTTRVVASAQPGVLTVHAVIAPDAHGQRLLAGLKAALGTSAIKLDLLPVGSLADRSTDGLRRLGSRAESVALVVDEPAAGGADATALTKLGAIDARVPPAPVLLSERVLSEPLIRKAGDLGRQGVLQGVTEVSTTTRDALLYRQTVPPLYPGELPSLDGLRGYVTGLALRDALRKGTGRGQLEAGLDKPDVFTDALLTPWNPEQPALGSLNLLPVSPQFLPERLVPVQVGGETVEPAYFPDGTWTLTSQVPLGRDSRFAIPIG